MYIQGWTVCSTDNSPTCAGDHPHLLNTGICLLFGCCLGMGSLSVSPCCVSSRGTHFLAGATARGLTLRWLPLLLVPQFLTDFHGFSYWYVRASKTVLTSAGQGKMLRWFQHVKSHQRSLFLPNQKPLSRAEVVPCSKWSPHGGHAVV